MSIGERELRERLGGEDDQQVESTLHEHFHAVPRAAPLAFDWCLRPGLHVEPDLDVGWPDKLGGRLLDLANAAERRVRDLRFRRRQRRRPQWPVIVCEGDSWVAHPFLKDLTDHLLDEDRHQFNVWSTGAAADRLAEMEAARDYSAPLARLDASAILVSGGGNDLLLAFDGLKATVSPSPDPAEQILELLRAPMHEVICTMARVLADLRTLDADAPIFVHGYDYLRVGPRGRGTFLSPFFDHMGVDELATRRSIIVTLVDRFNADLAELTADLPGVVHVDLRGRVPDDEWHDEIHPDHRGFRRIADAVAEQIAAH